MTGLVDDPVVRDLVLRLVASHPGLAKTKPDPEDERASKVRAVKTRWIALRESLGIMSRRECARILGMAPGTLDGWENMAALDREPKPSAFDRLPGLVAELKARTGT